MWQHNRNQSLIIQPNASQLTQPALKEW